MNGFEKMNCESKDLIAERIEQLKQLFPEIATEGDGSVDFEKLRLILGDEVNESDERYAFTWPGKRDAIRQSQTPSTATLRPAVDESRGREGEDGSFDSDNLYIEGDNLEVLKLLQHSYHGGIDLIFIDPPYNTGHDFIYTDTFAEPVDNYRKQISAIGQSNADTSGRYHANWCSMMYARLKLARELLSGRGAMFISIDHVEFSNLKKICDEIFGESCYIAHVAWQSSDNSNNNALTFSEDFNDILVYSRMPSWCPNFINDPSKRSHFKNPDNDPKGPWFDGNPVNNPGLRPNLQFDITTPSGNVIRHPENGWRWSRESMDEKFKTGELRFSEDETRVIRRTYLKDMEGLPPSTLWTDFEKTGHTRRAKYELKSLFPDTPVTSLFSTPKPTDLISYIAQIGSDKNSIIMDFFAGSGSSAEAVMRLNVTGESSRKFIAVQIPEVVNQEENLFDMSVKRVYRAGSKIAAEISESNKQLKLGEDPKPIPDIGFRVFKLDESGINKQDLNAAAERGELFDGDSLLDSVVKPNRSDMDIVFEMMLKWGLELTLPVEQTTIADYKCYVVAGGELICCMEQGLTVEALEAIADIEPRRVLMLDSILTDTLKLNAVQIFKRVGDRTCVEVELKTV